MKDVARELGVSVATVSYALNGRGTIGEELRAKVREVADRVGYRPNRMAQAIRTGRTMSIGLLVPDLNNPFYPALAQSVEREAREAGYAVVLIDTASFDDEGAALRQIESHIAGAVWCQLPRKDRPAEDFQVPIVVIGIPEGHVDNVTADDAAGGRLAARHLLKLGHRRVGVLTGASVPDGMDDRRAAFVEAFSSKGEIVWDVKTAYSIDLHRRLFNRLARRDVTAVMCGNDQIAIGVLRAAKQLGIAVPGELSVTGFDDIPWAQIVTPTLTTISQSVSDMATAAVGLLRDRIADPGRAVRHLTIGVRLMKRDSTSPPAGFPSS
ncbi:MAG TPA: LacI family DNA-binding transcriptional regulator [Kaistia sp.]|nr:LacI family DNA-binding transcriptional regulator [Kaistia sp.]